MDNFIEIKNLSKSFGNVKALDNISVSLPKGKIIGLLGPNGSGKTTLIKIINDLLTPTNGTVTINGMAPGVETKKIISFLPERTYLQPYMKVGACVNYFADFYSDFDKERALTMLSAFHIDLNSRLKSLSKGTKEKVQLVLVMSRRAQLYILDEPIGGVDPAARDFILKTILTNYDQNASILISTHLISDIEGILDEALFLKYGQIYMYGDVEKIREANQKSLDDIFREVFAC